MIKTSLLYLLHDNSTRALIDSASIEKTAKDLAEWLDRDNPKAQSAIGHTVVGHRSLAVEFGKGSYDEFLNILKFQHHYYLGWDGSRFISDDELEKFKNDEFEQRRKKQKETI